MLRRCYDVKQQERQPTYKGCSVSEKWLNFQNFAQWHIDNYVEGFHLDKDILQKGNKVYSSETCCFVPQEINKLFTARIVKREYPTGVYKNRFGFVSMITFKTKTYNLGSFKSVGEASKAYEKAKNEAIKQMAEEWKDKLSEIVYKTLKQIV